MQRKRQHVEIFLQVSRSCYVIWLHCDDSEAPQGPPLGHHSFQRCGPGYLFMLGCSTISLAARGRSIQMMCWFFPAVLLKFHMRSDAALNPFAVAFASATAGRFNGAKNAAALRHKHEKRPLERHTAERGLLVLKLAESAGVSRDIFIIFNESRIGIISAFSDP